MIQPPEAQLAYLGFQRIPPSPLLRPFVRTYWTFRRQVPLTELQQEYMHPRGGYGIVFNFGDALTLDSTVLTDPMFLDGTNTISRKMGFYGTVDVMGISFHEGSAYPFLTIPLIELSDEIALLDALQRPVLMRLYARLYDAKTLDARIALIEAWLFERLKLGKLSDPLVPASLELIRQTEGIASIAGLADRLAISQRQLERLYHIQVGMTPKQYAGLVRVEAARLRLKAGGLPSMAYLAADLGFYDQSHFIREFRAVIGLTPHRYMQRSQAR